MVPICGTDYLSLTAPDEVGAPYINESSDSWLMIGWDVPNRPNGPITGYFLYHEGKQVYGGAFRQFNVSELLVSLLNKSKLA